jgi:predicted GIY-YIG superfamily endonuclease
MYLVYILKSGNYSYVGMTNDFTKRLRQHNKEIKGGARYTSKRTDWYPVLIIDGFQDMKSAMQCEWRLKHFPKSYGNMRRAKGRVKYLSKFLYNDKEIKGFYTYLTPITEYRKWTTKCEKPIIDQMLTFYIDNEYLSDFKDYPHNYNHKELYWK